MSSRSLRPAARYLLAATVVAVLDIAFAIGYWAGYRGITTAPRILRSIASGLLGPSAMSGGSGVAVLGAALHFLVALIWTAVMVAALQLLPAARQLLRRPSGVLLLGMPFGILVWLVMNFVVVPLTHGQATPWTRQVFWVMLIWHAIGVGTPMAAILRDGWTTDSRSSG